MDVSKIIKILKSHYINTRMDDGNLYAEDAYTINGQSFSKWVNVTGWTREKLYSWLGY